MADIVNLRQARKARKRVEQERAAEENRRAFGRTKAERQLQKTERERAARAIEAHRREPEP